MSVTNVSAPPRELAVLFFRDALSRARHLKSEARTLADYEYRSSTPQRVARLLYDIVEHGEQAIQAEWNEYQQAQTDADRTAVLKNVQIWDSVLRTTGGKLRYLIGASASRVPSGLGLLLETIVQDQELGDGILLREKWSYNYSLDTTPIERGYHEALSGALSPDALTSLLERDGFLSSTYAIGFPAIERNNALLHCAVAHEVGHIAVERWLREVYDSDKSAAAESRAAAKKLSKLSGGDQGELAEFVEITNATYRIQSARRRFLQEYGSDVYAVELFGPAAMFAMTSIATSQGLDNEPRVEKDYYPSWRSRLRFALDWLNRTSEDPWIPRPTPKNPWAESLSRHLQQLELFLGPPPEYRNPEMVEADQLAKKTLTSMGPDLAAAIPVSRRESMQQAYELADRLDKSIPPNDIGMDQLLPIPPHLWAILNAGWLFILRRNEESGYQLGDSKDKDVANRLILKALSDVIVMRDFRRYQKESHPT